MLHGAKVAVVIPARNEEAFIAEVVATMPGFVDHLVLVDDGSSDATVARAREVATPRLDVVSHARSRGVGAAIVSGYRRARDGGADVVAVMAGDGQMHPDDLQAVVEKVARNEADYVKGDRFAHPDVWRVMPLHRHLAGSAFAWLTRVAAGLDRLSDSQCGFTAIRRDALDRLDLDALWPGYGYPNDLLGALSLRGLRIAEVVVRPVYRGEQSGLRPWHVGTVAWLVGRVAWRRAVR